MNLLASSALGRAFFAIAIFCMAIAIVIIGKPLLAPLALSIIIAFVLTPIVRRLESFGVGRIASVLTIVVLLVIVSLFLGAQLLSQLNALVAELPQRNDALLGKIMARKQTVPHVEKVVVSGGEATDSALLKNQKAFGIGLSEERTNSTLRAVELTCPTIEWVLGHSLNQGAIRTIAEGGFSSVLICALLSNLMEVIEAFAKRLRSSGYPSIFHLAGVAVPSHETLADDF